MSEERNTEGTPRPELPTKKPFVPPAILTLPAVPSFARSGSSA